MVYTAVTYRSIQPPQGSSNFIWIFRYFPWKTADCFRSNRFGYLWCKLVCKDTRISVLWVETILLSFFEPFLRQFWIFWKLKITYFTLIAAQKHHDFPLKSSHFESPQFSSSPTVTSLVLFPTIYRQLSRPLYDYEGQKVALFTCHYLCDPKSN